MGLARTLQEVEGWRGQYERVLRWQRRIRTSDEARSSADQLDFLLAFFTSCFDLRDWLITSGVDRKSVTALFRSNVELRVCRDIANGFKHYRITDHPYDAGFSVVREYIPKTWPSYVGHGASKWNVVAGDDMFDLVALAHRCVDLLREFLRSQGLDVA